MSDPLRECCDCEHIHKESECNKVRNYDYGGVEAYDNVCPKCGCKEYYKTEETNKKRNS